MKATTQENYGLLAIDFNVHNSLSQMYECAHRGWIYPFVERKIQVFYDENISRYCIHLNHVDLQLCQTAVIPGVLVLTPDGERKDYIRAGMFLEQLPEILKEHYL